MPRAAWYFTKFTDVSSSYGNNATKSSWWYLKQQTVSLKKVFIKAFQKSQIRGGETFHKEQPLITFGLFSFLSSAYSMIHKGLPKML